MLQIHETDPMSFVNAWEKTRQNTGIDLYTWKCLKAQIVFRLLMIILPKFAI